MGEYLYFVGSLTRSHRTQNTSVDFYKKISTAQEGISVSDLRLHKTAFHALAKGMVFGFQDQELVRQVDQVQFALVADHLVKILGRQLFFLFRRIDEAVKHI